MMKKRERDLRPHVVSFLTKPHPLTEHTGKKTHYILLLIQFPFLFLFKKIFIWLCQVLVAACGIEFPDWGLNLGPLH